jgi:N-methylhydantoinase B
LKSLIDPFVPNNEGALRPLTVKAPKGSILNAEFPVAVDARSLVSHYLHAAIFTALAPAMPRAVIGHCGGPGVRAVFSGMKNGIFFSATVFTFGGMGGRLGADGLTSTSFPTIASCPPVEVLEELAPILVHEKRILRESGGEGRYRGGRGHRFTIEVIHDEPIECSLMGDRLRHPPLGVLGGSPGSPVRISLNGAPVTNAKRRLLLSPGDVLVIDGPGGGGYGESVVMPG